MDKLETAIKESYLKERVSRPGARENAAYPDAHDFYLYLTGKLSDKELEKMLKHLRQNSADQDFAVKARGILETLNEAQSVSVPRHAIARAQSLMGKARPSRYPSEWQRLVSGAWLLLSIASFGMSFRIRHYFVQWVAIAVLCAVKWIMDERALKTRIMIYKALHEEPTAGETKDLHRVSSHL